MLGRTQRGLLEMIHKGQRRGTGTPRETGTSMETSMNTSSMRNLMARVLLGALDETTHRATYKYPFDRDPGSDQLAGHGGGRELQRSGQSTGPPGMHEETDRYRG